MFSAFNTFGRLGAAATTQWNPLRLWPDGIATPGMWISPRDLTSQWQAYTGTRQLPRRARLRTQAIRSGWRWTFGRVPRC